MAQPSVRPQRKAAALSAFVTAPIAAVLLSLTVPPACAADPTQPVPQAAVEALNKLSGGPHPGYRANHAKGVLVSGSFTPSATAATLSKATHLNAQRPVPILVRFSDATGVPSLPDADPNASPHGMAIRFLLPDGASTDIVSISADRFPVATPEDFVAFLQAVAGSGPDAPSPKPIEQFLSSHPLAAKWVTTPRPAPTSFATLGFYGVNAFKFTNSAGRSSYVRYQILPLAGESALSDAEVAKAGPDYLMTELPARLSRGPVKFRLLAQVAKPGDPVDDGSQAWPDDRQRVELGVLTLAKVAPDQVAAQKALLFNPLALTSGIEASADPVLLVRPAAYGVSYAQRAQ